VRLAPDQGPLARWAGRGGGGVGRCAEQAGGLDSRYLAGICGSLATRVWLIVDFLATIRAAAGHLGGASDSGDPGCSGDTGFSRSSITNQDVPDISITHRLLQVTQITWITRINPRRVYDLPLIRVRDPGSNDQEPISLPPGCNNRGTGPLSLAARREPQGPANTALTHTPSCSYHRPA
jgi:hypothetical protein